MILNQEATAALRHFSQWHPASAAQAIRYNLGWTLIVVDHGATLRTRIGLVILRDF